MTDRDQLKITFDSGGKAAPTGTAWVPPDESYDEVVRLANLRPPDPGIDKLARNLR